MTTQSRPESRDDALEAALERERDLRQALLEGAYFHVKHDGTPRHPETCHDCRAIAEQGRPDKDSQPARDGLPPDLTGATCWTCGQLCGHYPGQDFEDVVAHEAALVVASVRAALAADKDSQPARDLHDCSRMGTEVDCDPGCTERCIVPRAALREDSQPARDGLDRDALAKLFADHDAMGCCDPKTTEHVWQSIEFVLGPAPLERPE